MPKISELPDATTPLDGDEYVIVVQGGTTKKVAASDVGSPGGGGGSTPTGTGFRHVTGGVEDGAAKLVENADVHAAAAIAASKVVQATGTGFPHVTSGALDTASKLVENADVHASAAIALSKTALSANAQTWLTTPSSANLRTLVSDETGTGALFFAGGDFGAATGTSAAVTSFYSVSTLGGAVASSGQQRWSSSFQFKALNAAETQNATLFAWSSDVLTVGDATYTTSVQLQSTTSHTFTIGAGQKVVIDSNGFRLNDGAGHYYTIAVSSLAASRTCTLPVLTGNDTFVFNDFAATLTNKTLTAPVISTISNTGTLTLPTATTTLVGRDTTDTLTNKTISLTSNTLTFTSAQLATACSDETGSAGNLVFSTNPSLTAPTMSSPVVTGTPQYTGTRVTKKTVIAEVQTSSTTQTTCGSYTMSNETLCAFEVHVTCARRTNVTKGGRYKRSVVYRRTSSGAPTIVGTLESGTDQETTAGDDVTVDVSSNDVRVRVTAADSDGRNWTTEIYVTDQAST